MRPNKNEIWTWKWKHSIDVHTSNILEINDKYFKIAMFNRKPNLRKIKFTDVEFLENKSTEQDGTIFSNNSTYIANGNKIATYKPSDSMYVAPGESWDQVITRSYFRPVFTRQYVKEDVCAHIWDVIDGRLQCEFCQKIKDE